MENNKIKILLIGFITGIINGLFGSGGGTIIVPSLVFLLGLEDYKAHATAISIILPISIIRTILSFSNNMIQFELLLPVISGGVIGSFIGAKLLNKIPINILRKIFGTLIILSSIRLVIR